MKFKDGIYGILVNRVPGIQERYNRYRNETNGIKSVLAWSYLICLNISYYIFCNKKIAQSKKYQIYEKRILYTEDSESSISYKELPEEYAKKMAEFDVISFDVFDTLIFRPFSTPSDLFFLVGNKLNYVDFKRIRCEMEQKARRKKFQKEKHYEVNLDDIYTVLSEETGINKNQAMEVEIELEYECCFANPYMLQVIDELKKANKKVIITSDMYLSTVQIRTLLSRCGYSEFSSYYVSSDEKKSKNRGDIFDEIKRKEGYNYRYAHVGDNQKSDIQRAKEHGFTPFYYINVNLAGKPYRPEDMSVIVGGIYRGMINAHIHNGLYKLSREYEYGYIYGGLFVTGFCQFIHEYKEKHDVDKILFLSRDGDVLKKAYNYMYPKEKDKTQYVYWSRMAAAKMTAKHYKYDYFQRFLFYNINQNYTLQQIFSTMDIENMLGEFCDVEKVNPLEELTSGNVNKVKKFIQNSWNRVLAQYDEQLEAGRLYFSKILDECNNAIAVDIGWTGSGAILLNYVVNDIWNMACNIVGIIAGTLTCNNLVPDSSETFLQSGQLVSYLYSQAKNRDLWKLHNQAKGHNLYWEILLTASEGSFQGFYLNDNKCELRFRPLSINSCKVDEVQRGILDFIKAYEALPYHIKDLFVICGRDAYAPMLNILNGKSKKFMKVFEDIADDPNVI